MITRLPRASRVQWLVAILLTIAFAAASTHGRSGDRVAHVLEAVFATAEAALPHDTPPSTVDLHDGLTPVPVQWRERFEGFAASDRVQATGGDTVVFVGSSSIEFWHDLPAQFPSHRVVARGLAGATMADCVRHVDRLILPSRPRTVVVYAGDNDLAAGVSPAQVAADTAALVARVRRDLPQTRFVFVSIKPSPVRAGLMPLIRRANALIAAYAATERGLDFVDVFEPMLDRDARARPELFLADGLHLTAGGYAVWRDAIAGHLD